MKRKELKKLLQEVFRNTELGDSSPATSKCLSDDIIKTVYERRLKPNQRDTVIDHLYECNRCCKDLKFYFDLMESTGYTVDCSLKSLFNS